MFSRRLLTVLVVALSFASAQSKRPITDRDLFQFQWIGDTQVSPDGSKTVFVRVNVDDKKTGYDTSLWMISNDGTGAPIRLTNGKHDSSPRWSPDGRWIAFVRGPEAPATPSPTPDPKAPHPQIALLSLAGGEAWTITDATRGASNPVWSPDGKRIAFLCDANPDDIAKAAAKDSKPAEHESDVKVITRAVYRANGAGYLDPKHHQHIWITDVPTASDTKSKAVQLTTRDYDEQEPLFTPDGDRILFHTDHNVEPYYNLPSAEIDSVPSRGGEVQVVAKLPMGVNGLSLSPDGKRLAFHAESNQPVRSYSEPDLWTLDVGSGSTNNAPKNLTANYDYDMGSGVGGDNSAPRGGGREAIQWTPDGTHILDTVAKQGLAILVSVDANSGAVTEITRGNQAVQGYAQSKDGRTLIAKISTPTMIDELFSVSPNG